MYNSILGFLTASLDKRFILSFFSPCLFFLGLLAAIGAFANNAAKVLETWVQFPFEIKALLAISFITLALFGAYLLAGLLPVLSRFYEGEWVRFPLLNWIKKKRIEYYTANLATLSDQVADVNAYITELNIQLKNAAGDVKPLGYAQQTMKPTELGNRVLETNLYAFHRYNLDPVLIWLRLQPLLPDRLNQTLVEAKSSYDFMLIVSFLSSLLMGLIVVFGFIFHLAALFFLLIFISAGLVSWAAYKAAISAAIRYGQAIQVAYDLYRLQVIKSFNLTPPKDYQDELKRWKMLNQLLKGDTLIDLYNEPYV